MMALGTIFTLYAISKFNTHLAKQSILMDAGEEQEFWFMFTPVLKCRDGAPKIDTGI